MTIRDMMNQGVIIEGHILIRRYNEDTEKYITLYEGECINFDTKGIDHKITYIYNRTESQINSMYPKSGLYIEVE